jgi:hypothetical protein
MTQSAARDPSVFIVESLSFDDEQAERREGHLLYEMLHLIRKPAEYRHIRTKKELAAMLRQFHDSGKRYLHNLLSWERGWTVPCARRYLVC